MVSLRLGTKQIKNIELILLLSLLFHVVCCKVPLTVCVWLLWELGLSVLLLLLLIIRMTWWTLINHHEVVFVDVVVHIVFVALLLG